MNLAPQIKVALLTGSARRLGAAIAELLHSNGFNIALHYRSAEREVIKLQQKLEEARPGSTVALSADLRDPEALAPLVEEAARRWGRLDCLVNNAARFYPTPLESATLEQCQELMDTNLRAPFFLAQAAAKWLKPSGGCLINIADIYAERPLPSYPIYSITKAGISMLTKSLAQELGPEVRVNAIAPGAILWPEGGVDEKEQKRQAEILNRIALRRCGTTEEIARAVLFLVRDATYSTGQILAVDGGRSTLI